MINNLEGSVVIGRKLGGNSLNVFTYKGFGAASWFSKTNEMLLNAVAMMITGVLAIGIVAMWTYFNSLISQLPRHEPMPRQRCQTAMSRTRLLLMRDRTVIGGTTMRARALLRFVI